MREVKILLVCLLFLQILLQAQTLGANIKNGGVEFSIYSENATRVELWLFKEADTDVAMKKVALTKGTGNVWSTFVSGVGAGTYYGYRVWGPNWNYEPSWTPGSSIGFISDIDEHEIGRAHV